MKKEKPNNKKQKKTSQYGWIIHIFVITFILGIVISIISESLIRNVSLVIANVILLLVIMTGVIFDTIGIAVTAAEEKPFHAMASHKILEANYAVHLIKNAGPVANFCNDVIGDIAGIISGTIVAAIVFRTTIVNFNFTSATLSIILSAVVASLTVGGKAFGKEYAMRKSSEIVLGVSKVIYKIDKRLGCKILKKLKNKKRKSK